MIIQVLNSKLGITLRVHGLNHGIMTYR